MITIYCTTPFYFKNVELFTPVETFTEYGLLNLVREDENAIWFVKPHRGTEFFKHFIEGNLDREGYIVEGVYWAKLCSQRVDFRLINDINSKIARNK